MRQRLQKCITKSRTHGQIQCGTRRSHRAGTVSRGAFREHSEEEPVPLVWSRYGTLRDAFRAHIRLKTGGVGHKVGFLLPLTRLKLLTASTATLGHEDTSHTTPIPNHWILSLSAPPKYDIMGSYELYTYIQTYYYFVFMS